jgi:hypothetical protein
MRVRFVFVGEGTSDAGLVAHLQELCVQCGASEATGSAPAFWQLPQRPGKKVVLQVNAALALEPTANLVFVHRDADSRSEDDRIEEIQGTANECSVRLVPVVPIQETEAWLLLDEQAIREVVENPRGRVALGLPRPNRVEDISSPKERLKEALARASELRGRRLQRLNADFPRLRTSLIQRLRPSAMLTSVGAWIRLTQRTRQAIQALDAAPGD